MLCWLSLTILGVRHHHIVHFEFIGADDSRDQIYYDLFLKHMQYECMMVHFENKTLIREDWRKERTRSCDKMIVLQGGL